MNKSIFHTSLLVALLSATALRAQQTPFFTENFEGGNGTTLSGWTFVNGSQTNKWQVGTATNNGGSKAAYISNDGGTTNAYSIESASVVHLYRDITFPATTGQCYVLSFDYKVGGLNTYPYEDVFEVFLVPTSVTPVAGSTIEDTYPLYRRMDRPAWVRSNIELSAATYKGKTYRLVFTWRNKAAGVQPPVAIDNVSLEPHLPINIAVTNTNTSGVGSLDQALHYDAYSGDTVRIAPNLAGKVITPSYHFVIDRNLTIEGNGIILSGDNAHDILWVADRTVNINGVHFTKGSSSYGGAIYCTDAVINLQNCIFSNNYGSSYAGAIYVSSGSNLNVKGCTFYNNSAHLYGGAIYATGTTTLTGNLFYNNTDQAGIRPIDGGTPISGGYNVYDEKYYGDIFKSTGDKQVKTLSFNTTYFNPTVAGKSALQIVPNLSNFPKTDFYGLTRSPYPTVAGAVAGDYVVTFAMQTGGDNPATVVKSNSLVPTAITPVREGYTVEWYKEAGYINRWNFATDLVTQDVTLYAKWTALQTISWDQRLSLLLGKVSTLALNATASSGLPVSYSLSNSTVATLNNGILTIKGLGTVDITVSQAGNDTCHAAPSVTRALTVYELFTHPVVDATVMGYIDDDSVVVNTRILDAGLPPYIERGFCYGTATLPDTNGAKVSVVGDGAGNYTATLHGLAPNTLYYVRAYAVNPDTTVYGTERIFITRNNTNYFNIAGYGVTLSKPSFVKILFSVKDQNGLGEDQLKNENFEIVDNGEDMMRDAEAFPYIRQMEAVPFTLKTILMLDYSLSMDQNNKIQDLKAAAVKMIRDKHATQEFAIYRFASSVSLVQDFTADTTSLITAIKNIPEVGTNSTNLYGAYIEGMNYLPQEYHTADSIRQCFMVIFTDGEDTRRERTLAEAQQYYNGEDVFIIGPNTMNASAVAGLGSFRSVVNMPEVTEKFTRIQAEMILDANSNYLLTYMSPRGNGAFSIDVKVKGNTNSNTSTNHYLSSYTTIGAFDYSDDVMGGVFINPYTAVAGQTYGMYGLDDGYVYAVETFATRELNFATYWATLPPVYQWSSSDPSVAEVVYNPFDFDKARLVIKQKPGEAILTLTDTTNYLCVKNGQSSIPASFADRYRRSIRVNVRAGSGINEVSAEKFVLYPNPAKNNIHIKGASGKRVTVYSTFGYRMFEKELGNDEETLLVSDWASGVYFVRISDNWKIVGVVKLVKE